MGLMVLRPSLRASHGGYKKLSSLSVSLPVVAQLCLVCLLLGYLLHQPALEHQVVSSPPRKLYHTAEQQQQHYPQEQQQLVITAKKHLSQAAPASSAAVLPDMNRFSQQFLQQSQLQQLRPPLTPAESGDASYTVIPYQILSWYPRIVVYPAFIDSITAAHFISLAKERMALNETSDPYQKTGTSKGVFVNSEQHDPSGRLRKMEEKIAAVTLIPPSHGEAFNVLHYQQEQEKESHMDTYDPKDFGPQSTQRMTTMILVLSNVEEGGETVFKREGKDGDQRPVTDWAGCEPDAFKYKPRLGDAVLFHSLDPDLTINPRALHGGCPIRKGEKWVAVRWLHEKPLDT